NAGRREHTLAFDLDHAGPAISVGPVAGLGRMAQMRDLDPVPACCLPDRLAGARFDLLALEDESDCLAYGAPIRHGSECSRRIPRRPSCITRLRGCDLVP